MVTTLESGGIHAVASNKSEYFYFKPSSQQTKFQQRYIMMES